MGQPVNLIDLLQRRLNKSSEEIMPLLESIKEDILQELLKGNKVEWRNIFSLVLNQKAVRLKRNPLTDVPVVVPPRRSLQLKIGKSLKERLNAEIMEKHIVLLTTQPARFDEMVAALKQQKIVVETINSFDALMENLPKLPNALLAVLDFLPDSLEYDAAVNLLKTNKTLPLLGLIGLIPANYAPQNINNLKIMCDRWVPASTGLNEIKELVLTDIARLEEERFFFKKRLKIRLPTDEKYLEKLTRISEELVANSGFSAEKRDEFIPAIKEAIMNSARHGNKYQKDKFLEVEYLVDKEKAVFTITDEGPGFDYEGHLKKAEGVPEEVFIHTREKPSEQGAGLGVILMKRCVDEVLYTAPGNSISLVKYLKSAKKT